MGAGPGTWWARDLIHSVGGSAIRTLGIAALLGCCLTLFVDPLKQWRRPASYLILAATLATGSVGLLRAVSNVDCPWSLDVFSGTRPYVGLLGDRPDDLPRARCFPGGHSSSGFALFALYFLFRDRRPRTAYAGLAAALSVGALFAFGQEARGAHFLSHDLWSAGMAWFSCLAVYRLGYGGNPWRKPTPESRHSFERQSRRD